MAGYQLSCTAKEIDNRLDKIKELSHVGMIIHSTTLDTMEKVIKIYGGTIWYKIEGMFLLGQSNTYAVNSTGGEASHTLSSTEMPSHAHSVGAHSHSLNGHRHTIAQHTHGLNNHTHPIPTLTGTAAFSGEHNHEIYYRGITGTLSATTTGGWFVIGSSSNNNGTCKPIEKNGYHVHDVVIDSSETAGANGQTKESDPFLSEEAPGSTANSEVFSSSTTGSNIAHNNMPPYKTVYIWERTA